MFVLLQEIMYGQMHKGILRTAVHASKGVLEIMEYPSLKEITSNMLEQLEREATEVRDALVDETPDSAVTVKPHFVNQDDEKKAGVLNSLGEDNKRQVDNMVNVHTRRYVSLNVYPEDLNEVRHMVAEHELASQIGDMTGLTLIHLNPGVFGEAATQPRSRPAPLPERMYEKVCASVVLGRYKGDDPVNPTINDGELVCLMDGAKRG